jgi:Amt family ammonium transporter
VLPWQGVIIGIAAGAVCFYACTELKVRLGYDDSLDVFGVHGVGGLLGTLLCGVFATASLSVSAETPAGLPGLIEGNPMQVAIQLLGCIVTLAWSGGITYGLLTFMDYFIALRVEDRAEVEGLDITQHGESIHS